ncbi:MAG: fumarylacetoacetate hydrolase family protein [Paracoccaceae bacterium]
MGFVIPAPAQASVAIAGSADRFPVRRIFCVGRNYADHAREMGADPDREPPFFFTKPADAVVDSGSTIPYPPETQDLHFETELVVAIGKGGRDIAEGQALAHVWGYACGNDLTRRDMQNLAKQMRRPWDMSKGFDHSAVVGPLQPGQAVPQGRIAGLLDGEVRQQATIADMIWPVEGVIAHLSRLVELAPGDLIFTGTPAGVGAIAPGQSFAVEIDGLMPATVTVRA